MKLIFLIIFLIPQLALAQDCPQDILKQILNSTREEFNPGIWGSFGFYMTQRSVNKEVLRVQKVFKGYALNFEYPQKLKGELAVIRADNSLTENEKSYKIYKAVIEEELKVLDRQAQWDIRKLMDNFDVTHDNEFQGFFSHSYKQDEINVNIPLKLKGTAIDYLIRVHEVMHAIHWKIILKHFEGNNYDYKKVDKAEMRKHARLNNEETSMAAEFRYIQQIPEQFRRQLIKEIAKLRPNAPKNSDFAIRVLSSPKRNKTSLEHVNNEQTAGRYDLKGVEKHLKDQRKEVREQKIKELKEFLRKHRVKKRVIKSVGLATITLTPTLFAVCLNQIDDKGHFPATEFFKVACLKNPITSSFVDMASEQRMKNLGN